MIRSVSFRIRGDFMIKKEMIAMLLAGGQGSRLGILTRNRAKPSVHYGGKYSIIDFPLSNCINSGVDTVGVLTQYQPLQLNSHIGIGIPWDLDKNIGGVTILPPYERQTESAWYSGTANAVYQNLHYMEQFHPEYVLVLAGDHIYKMDYGLMLQRHKAAQASVTIATMPVPEKDASRFGIVVTDQEGVITDFQEKPEVPKSSLASMGIYIFNFDVLKEALVALRNQKGCDFGKHLIPYIWQKGERLVSYEHNGYWKDVGTLGAYWEANMDLLKLIPEFNLYEEFWQIYTRSDILPPMYASEDAVIEGSIIGDGAEIYGEVYSSVIGPGVIIEKGAIVRNSIIMHETVIEAGAMIEKAVIAENSVIGARSVLGVGGNAPNGLKPEIYCYGLVTVGEGTEIPKDVQIGKNTVIAGQTTAGDYPGGMLKSGGTLVKAGENL